MRHVGLIGVGFVGERFTTSLVDAGYPVTAYDVKPERNVIAEDKGATVASGPQAVAEIADAVILSLVGTSEVEAVLAGDTGILDVLGPDQVLIDTTTVHPETAAWAADACADRGTDFVSAPLTRTAPTPGMHFLLGGDTDAIDEAAEFLHVLGTGRVRIGDPAEALRFKLALQLRYAGHLAVDAEVVAYVHDQGIDPGPLEDVLGMDLAGGLLSGDYRQDRAGLGGLATWHKDLGYLLDAAQASDSPVPLTAAIHEAYKAGQRAAAPAEKDATAISRYWLPSSESR